MNEHVNICEVGPRDGLQIAKSRMATDAKVRWIAAMAAAGVKQIEVGSFVPPRVIPQMADTEEVVRRCLEIPGLTVIALVPNLRGAQNAYAAGTHKISVPVSVSEGHSRANLNRTPAESIAEMQRLMEWVKSQPRRMEVIAGASTAFGCSIDGVVPTAKVIEVTSGLARAGVDKIMLADTVGYAHPAQVKQVVRAVREAIGPVLHGLHLHDTMGLGLANALAGLEEDIRAFEFMPRRPGGMSLRAGGLGQRGDGRSGVHAGKHGVHNRDRPAEADRCAPVAARGTAGGANAGPGPQGRDPEDLPQGGLNPASRAAAGPPRIRPGCAGVFLHPRPADRGSFLGRKPRPLRPARADRHPACVAVNHMFFYRVRAE